MLKEKLHAYEKKEHISRSTPAKYKKEFPFLNVKGLLKMGLAKFIFDSGWLKFLTYLKYRAEWYGRTFIQAGRFFPSLKLCHYCGHKNEDSALHDRTWCYPVCGETHDGDVKVYISLYLVGLERLKREIVEQALVKTIAILRRNRKLNYKRLSSPHD
jgi:transposase